MSDWYLTDRLRCFLKPTSSKLDSSGTGKLGEWTRYRVRFPECLTFIDPIPVDARLGKEVSDSTSFTLFLLFACISLINPTISPFLTTTSYSSSFNAVLKCFRPPRSSTISCTEFFTTPFSTLFYYLSYPSTSFNASSSNGFFGAHSCLQIKDAGGGG
jgi:hypothetical protein